MIPYGRQDITEADIDAVTQVLRSSFLTQGPAVPAFEGAVAARVGVKHAVAVNSATSALHIACLALGLSPGDLLWTVPNTFVASANCARYCGAEVDFVDIDPVTYNMSVGALGRKLEAARARGQLPKVVVPVHFAGQPTEAQAIEALAQRYGFKILEDASHSIGAARDGEPVGSCRWSDLTVFSFHPVKIVTTCEGGMVLTNDARLAEQLMLFRSHGIIRDPGKFVLDSAPPWHYEQHTLGYNYRMTDVHACLGTSQLTRLDQYVQRRNQLAVRYDQALRSLPVRLPTVTPENLSAYHLYVVRVPRQSRRRIFEELRGRGIGVNVHYAPVHLQPYYRQLGFAPGYCPEAETYGEEAITLPLFAAMTDAEQDQVVAALRAVA